MREVLKIKHMSGNLSRKRDSLRFIVKLVGKCVMVDLARKYIETNGIELSEEGVGGTYFVRDNKNRPFAVFKPADEEPGSPNNPKKILLNPPLPPGGGAIREVAAYLIDRNFACVPETYLTDSIKHPLFCSSGGTTYKSGSLQKYVENMGDASTMGYSKFLVEDVHRIGILDIRLFNLDRSAENILVQKRNGQLRLVPIDHSYILPEKLNNAWFDWLYWPQGKVRFSKKTLAYIARINIEEDAEILKNLGFQEKNICTLRITTLFLKAGASVGLTLHEIAKQMCRTKLSEESSILEKLVAEAELRGNFYVEYEKILFKIFNGEKIRTKAPNEQELYLDI